MYQFDIWSSDVRKAYLQSNDPLSREKYLRDVPPEFELKPHERSQLLMPTYGLCESGDLWHEIRDYRHQPQLQNKPLNVGSALYTFVKNEALS